MQVIFLSSLVLHFFLARIRRNFFYSLFPGQILFFGLLLGVTVHEFMLISICQCLCHIMIVSWSHGFIGLVVSVVS